MKHIYLPLLILAVVAIFTACQKNPAPKEENPVPNTYTCISQEEAKNLMDTETGYIILDVRRQDEYDAGHIPNAVLLPNETLAETAESVLKDKDQLILVYCRSGNRSKQASQKLADLGYTNVKEFGGIIDWPYDIVIECN
jgi:rhodanese-related sulfurtransferase